MRKLCSVVLALIIIFVVQLRAFADETVTPAHEVVQTVYSADSDDSWEEPPPPVAKKPLPLRHPNVISLNSRVYIPSAVGIFFSYDRAFLSWFSAGIGFGYDSGGAPSVFDIPFYQFVFPIYFNFYLNLSSDFQHRWLLSANIEPFLEYDHSSNCDSFSFYCNIPRRQYGGTYLGGGTGYEYRNEDGFLLRLVGLVLVPLPRLQVRYAHASKRESYIHYAVMPTVQFSLGYSF